MGDVRQYLQESELGTYQKVFPALSVPTLGEDAEGYMKTIAEAAIEQVKFLNTFSGIPLEVLYENVGQRHKASNMMLLSILRKLDTATGDGLNMVQVEGETGGSYESLFAEFAASEEFSETLWKKQTAVINRQSDWLKTLSGVYAEKIANLPQQPSMLKMFVNYLVEFIITEGVQRIVLRNIPDLPGNVEDYAATLISFFSGALLELWKYIKDYYNETCKILMQMVEENDALCQLDASYDNYRLRTDTLQQHEDAAKNIIELITGLEAKFEKVNPDQGLQSLIDVLETISYNEEFIDLAGVRVALRSKLIATEG